MTLREFYRKYSNQIEQNIIRALNEDRVRNDITTHLLFETSRSNAIITAELLSKENCVLAGIEIFKKVYKLLDRRARFVEYFKDGDRIRNKSIVLKVKAPLNVLLAGERVSLNFLQRMTGIATLTNEFVNRLKYRNAKILHTRKTTPNFRIFEAAAVKIGGGDFHRLDMGSAVMVKDNHIIAAGSLSKVLDSLNKKKLNSRVTNRFEVEVKTARELRTVIEKGKRFVRIVMLDNFPEGQLEEAVKLIKGNGMQVEISGGVNLKNFNKLQKKGVDYYSIGMLTHSYKSVDFSLEFKA